MSQTLPKIASKTPTPTEPDSLGDDLRRIAPELCLPAFAARMLDARLATAATTWQLSPRMLETLMLLAAGLSNKEIACARGRSEVTIEYHVTALLRRAGVDTRARLMAKFWLGLEPEE